MTIEEAREGMNKNVVYRPGTPNYTNRIFTVLTPDGGQAVGEIGIIVEVNERFVFVLYFGDRAAKATAPHDIDFIKNQIV